jgi:glutathione S-transferase
MAHTADFTLFGNAQSGHSYKVKLALEVAAIPHDFQTIDLSIPRDKRPEPFRSLAPFGEVPLLLHKGQALAQSNAILHYLAVHTGRWGAETPMRLNRALQWQFWESNRLGMSLPNLRFAQKFGASAYPEGSLVWLRQRFDLDIARLAQEFRDGRAFILDDQPSIADFSLCGYLFWADEAQVTVPPAVLAWLARIRHLPGWQAPYQLMAMPATTPSQEEAP